jgi:hypothetical protein
MNKVTGKILLQETGVGIPNLIVTIYDVDFDTLPKKALQSPQAKIVDSWDQLAGDRLGSILTDDDGSFVLEYGDKEFNEDRPDLLLFVTAPEGSGLNGCSPMLHVSCGIRQKAGRLESYLIRLTTEELKKAGVPLPNSVEKTVGAKALPARLLKVELQKRETGKVLEKVRTVWRQNEVPAPKISEVYRQKMNVLEQTNASNGSSTNSFRLSLPMISADGGQGRLVFNGESRKWFMNKGNEIVEANFTGVVSGKELTPGETPAVGINVVLNENKKEFGIVVSRAPVRLCAKENSPGELFIDTFKRRFVQTRKDSKSTDANEASAK